MSRSFRFAWNLQRPLLFGAFTCGTSVISHNFVPRYPFGQRRFHESQRNGRASRSMHCEAQTRFPVSGHARPKIILFGDSITQQSFSECGWGSGLYNWYHRAADIVNRGFSGYNTRWARVLLPGLLADMRPGPVLAVTLFFGANDSESKGQNVPLEEYEENLKAMIQAIKDAFPEAVIIAITPPPVDSERWPTRSIEAVSKYAAVVRQLPVSAVVDLWGHIDIVDLNDGLHLAPEGNRKVLHLVQKALQSQGLSPEDGPNGLPQMPMQFPHWSQLAGKTQEEATAVLDKWRWP